MLRYHYPRRRVLSGVLWWGEMVKKKRGLSGDLNESEESSLRRSPPVVETKIPCSTLPVGAVQCDTLSIRERELSS